MTQYTLMCIASSKNNFFIKTFQSYPLKKEIRETVFSVTECVIYEDEIVELFLQGQKAIFRGRKKKFDLRLYKETPLETQSWGLDIDSEFISFETDGKPSRAKVLAAIRKIIKELWEGASKAKLVVEEDRIINLLKGEKVELSVLIKDKTYTVDTKLSCDTWRNLD